MKARWVWCVLASVASLLAMTDGAGAKSAPATAFTPQTGGVYDYGVVPIGSHADQTFTLTNAGGTATAALTVSLTGASAFTKVADTCAAVSLGPGKKCTITVRYAPTGKTTDSAVLRAVSTKPAATASISLTGTGGYVDVSISPTAHDFHSSSGSQTFTATNNGNIATSAYAFSGPTDDHFAVTGTNTCDGSALAAGASCSFTISFTAPPNCAAEPTLYADTASLGNYASAMFKGAQPLCEPHLVIANSDPAAGVTGQWSPYNDAYWEFYGTSGAESFTLTNDGTASTGALTFHDEDSLQGGADAFSINLNSCANGTTLAIGASCSFTVTWDEANDYDCTHGFGYDPGADLWWSDASYADDTNGEFTVLGFCNEPFPPSPS